MADLLDAIKARRAVRKYTDQMVEREKIDKVIEAGLYAASSKGQQSPYIIAVTNKDLRDRLSTLNRELGGWEPPLVNSRKEITALHLLFFLLELDAELLEHFHELWLVTSHDGPGKSNDWAQDELAESPLKCFSLVIGGPVEELPGGGIPEPFTPKVWHELADWNTKLGGVYLGELGEGEAETVETRTEADGTMGWADSEVDYSIATFPGELAIEKGVFAHLTGDPPEASIVGVSNILCSERALIPSDSSHARRAPNGLPVLCASIPVLPESSIYVLLT